MCTPTQHSYSSGLLYQSGLSREREQIDIEDNADLETYFKELAQVIVGVGKLENCRSGQQVGGNSGRS